jgi:hypothetical protein
LLEQLKPEKQEAKRKEKKKRKKNAKYRLALPFGGPGFVIRMFVGMKLSGQLAKTPS